MTTSTFVLDQGAMEAARERWNTRAKPPGSLGRLEDLAVHLAGVTGQCPPPVPTRPAVAVFAGDHGVVADGASAWPQEITAAMVHTIAAGGAAISSLSRSIGASVTLVDVGVASPLDGIEGVRHHRVRSGTDSIVRGPAMTVDEAHTAVGVGAQIAQELIEGGADCVIGGEMGIGNTTPSAALIAAITGRDPASLVGPGAGAPVDGVDHKASLIVAAVERAGEIADPYELLAELGGVEIAALAGLYVTAAQERVPFIVDGVIATAALGVADRIVPGVGQAAIAGHRSTEPGSSAMLAHLGLDPVLELGLRLGEGSGAVLAFPVVAAAARAVTEMADLPTG